MESMRPLDHDIIGFCSYPENGQTWYGCRGIGSTYREFYQWLSPVLLVAERDDWPWHYFVFTKVDEQAFIHLWGNPYGIDDCTKHDDWTVECGVTGVAEIDWR